MTQKGGLKAAMANKGGTLKGGATSAVKIAGGGKTGDGIGTGAKGPSPKAAQVPSALVASRKSDDKVSKRGGRNGPDK